MNPIPAAIRPLMARARRIRAGNHGYCGRDCFARVSGIPLARNAVRLAMYAAYGYRREERRQLRRETARALDAAKRMEGALAARWGVK